MLPTFKYIVLHHSATVDGRTNNWEAIRRYHTSWRYQGNIISEIEAAGRIKRGEAVEPPWDDIGYHFGIELIGDKYQIMGGRSLDKMGAHAVGFNLKGIGVCLVGNFDRVPPCTAQWETAKNLCRDLKKHFSTGLKIVGHRETFTMRGVPVQKTCPGKAFDLERFRREV